MDGVVSDEAGRSINGTGSRTTGVTPCLKKLGVAVKVDGGHEPKRRRISQERPPECSAINPRRVRGGPQLADIPRTRRRNPKPEAKQQKQGRARASNAAKGKATAKGKAKPTQVVPAAAPRTRGSVQLGGQQCRKGTSLHILEEMLQAARSHKVTAANPLERAKEYANFLSALPSSLALGDYTSKHLTRKHLLQHIGAGGSGQSDTPGAGLGNITMPCLLEIFPDVGQHLAEVDSKLTPARLARVLGCATPYLTMWPCLLSEALQHRPQNAQLLWGKSIAEIEGALRKYRAQWGFNPSPRVLLGEMAPNPNKIEERGDALDASQGK